jgi:TorA-specific chaperone
MSPYPAENAAFRQSVLDALELADALFRGLDSQRCAELCRENLSGRFGTLPAQAAHLTDALAALQARLPAADGSSDAAAFCDALQAEHVRLFINDKAGAPALPYESLYPDPADGVEPRMMGAAALSMQKRLQAAGLERAVSANEPPDHLCIELEYLYYLLSRAWNEADTAAQDAAADFAAGVLLPWTRRLRLAVCRADTTGVYAAAAQVLLAVLNLVASLRVQ